MQEADFSLELIPEDNYLTSKNTTRIIKLVATNTRIYQM